MMSSIQAALSADINKNKAASERVNRVVLKSHQEQQDGPVGEDFFKRKEIEHEQARALRRAEGGRSGGYNDRQDPSDRRHSADVEEGLDDFGRPIKPKVDRTLSKAAQA